MNQNNINILKGYISNLDVRITMADYTHVPVSWQEYNIVPDYNKLYYICNGQGWIKLGDQKYYPVAGDLYWLPAGLNQSYSTINNNTYKKYWCHFSTSFNGLDISEFIQLPVFLKIKNNKKLDDLFLSLINNYNNTNLTAQLKARAVLLDIISYFIENVPQHEIRLKHSMELDNLNQLIIYINKNLNKNLTLDELAEQLNYHPNYLIKFFKKHIGKTPIQYIKEERLSRARTILQGTSTDIQEIAYQTGFNNVSYFSRCFKQTYGLAPSEIRSNKIKNGKTLDQKKLD